MFAGGLSFNVLNRLRIVCIRENFWGFFHFRIPNGLSLLGVQDDLWSRDQGNVLGCILIVIRDLLIIETEEEDSDRQEKDQNNPTVIFNPKLLLEFSSL